jgi:hypothetical protein
MPLELDVVYNGFFLFPAIFSYDVIELLSKPADLILKSRIWHLDEALEIFWTNPLWYTKSLWIISLHSSKTLHCLQNSQNHLLWYSNPSHIWLPMNFSIRISHYFLLFLHTHSCSSDTVFCHIAPSAGNTIFQDLCIEFAHILQEKLKYHLFHQIALNSVTSLPIIWPPRDVFSQTMVFVTSLYINTSLARLRNYLKKRKQAFLLGVRT